MTTRKLFVRLAFVFLFLFLTLSSHAQSNGVSGTRGAPPQRDTAFDPVTVPTAGPWQEFLFGGTGSFATGCLAGGCAGPGANSVFAGDPPWTFTAGAGGATIT